MRPGDDAVFRYGGEEFLIVLTNATADLAWTLAERIRRAVEAAARIRTNASTGDSAESNEQAHDVVDRLRKDVDDLAAALERSDRVA